ASGAASVPPRRWWPSRCRSRRGRWRRRPRSAGSVVAALAALLAQRREAGVELLARHLGEEVELAAVEPLAAVDGDHLAVDVAAAGAEQEDGEVGELARLAEAPERHLAQADLLHPRRHQPREGALGRDRPRRDGVA